MAVLDRFYFNLQLNMVSCQERINTFPVIHDTCRLLSHLLTYFGDLNSLPTSVFILGLIWVQIFDTMMVFLKDFFLKKWISKKSANNKKA